MHTKTLLLMAAALTLSAGAAFASEGQYVSPRTGEPTELASLVPDVPQQVVASASNADATHVFSAMSSDYTTNPSVMRMLFPEQVNQN